MNGDCLAITEGLRNELTEYGGLLHLFEQQQQALFERDADQVLQLSSAIEQQVLAMQDCRRRREQLVAAFALVSGRAANSTLRSLLPLFEATVQPLLEALINEVNVLIHRVRRVSHHNHTLLASAVESHQQVLRTLRPDAFTQTYTPAGRSRISVARRVPALRTAG